MESKCRIIAIEYFHFIDKSYAMILSSIFALAHFGALLTTDPLCWTEMYKFIVVDDWVTDHTMVDGGTASLVQAPQQRRTARRRRRSLF